LVLSSYLHEGVFRELHFEVDGGDDLADFLLEFA
jgi:hypothetical protein